MSKFKALGKLFSKTDEAAQSLKREKGTGEEFLREIQKTPGVKAAEIKDRKLDKVLPTMGKTTKAEVLKKLEQNPPPKLEETQSPVGESIGTQDFRQWLIPGGENYREILLKLPKTEPKLPPPENFRVFYDPGQGWVVQSSKRVVGPFAGESEATDKMFQLTRQARKETEALRRESRGFESPHWDQPNVLAHARVSDRVGPNGEKILHIEEIQSDWHQKGRKEGYKSGDEAQQIKELKDQSEYLSRVRKDLVRQADESKDLGKMSDYYDLINEINDITPQLMRLQTQMDNLRSMEQRGVPDAPFKKNWHELTMKRILDYAADKGYDKIAITPGAEQANRYKLSNHIDEIVVTGRTDALTGEKSKSVALDTKSGRSMRLGVAPDGTIDNVNDASISGFIGKKLDEVIGKDLSEKVMSGGSQVISGEGLTVGGEGMKGFYDQILPTYLNDLGKPYGATVGQMDIITKPEQSIPQIAAPGIGHFPEPIIEPAQTVKVHTFNITPQMREEIKTKGLPLYQVAAPVATGAAAAAMEEPAAEPEYRKGGKVKRKVKFATNPDAMRLEMMSRSR